MLTIGALQLEHPFVQAALSGYSDLPMRRVARAYGACYTVNEVMLDTLVLVPGKMSRRILDVADDDHPVGGQLMGAKPEAFGVAADLMARAGYDVIDINFGCPVKKVLGRCRGGFLLSNPGTALDMVRRVIDAVGRTHPVTVKMRRGTDDSAESERNFFKILDGAFALGVAAVTVHGRTVEQRYVGPSRWAFLEKVKKHVGQETILGSGDLFSAEACLQMIRETGVDGVTIARGCIGNPWIFQDCRALWKGVALPEPPSIGAQRAAIELHWRYMTQTYDQKYAPRMMRKAGIKYSEHHPLARDVRNAFVAVSSSDDVRAVIGRWYDPTVPWPAVRRRTNHGDLVAAGAEL